MSCSKFSTESEVISLVAVPGQFLIWTFPIYQFRLVGYFLVVPCFRSSLNICGTFVVDRFLRVRANISVIRSVLSPILSRIRFGTLLPRRFLILSDYGSRSPLQVTFRTLICCGKLVQVPWELFILVTSGTKCLEVWATVLSQCPSPATWS